MNIQTSCWYEFLRAKLYFTSAAAKQELPQVPGDGDVEEGKLIISDTGEFCRSLQLDEGETSFTSFNISIKYVILYVYLHACSTECRYMDADWLFLYI